MEKTSLKKILAYIMALMMLSAMPALVNAQKKCPEPNNCPKGYYCSDGYCVKFCTGPVCPKCPWPIIYKRGSKSISVTFSLDKPEKILVKIFNMTGRLVKTVTDRILKKVYMNDGGMHQE